MEKYITEREKKRTQGFDISYHKRYDSSRTGEFAYAGTRTIEGQKLALLGEGDVIFVLAIDTATARRLKRIRVGDPVTMNAGGSLKISTRKRRR